MEEFDQLWNEVKAQLADTLPSGASMLLSRVELRSIENGVALITAQSKFVLDSIKDFKTVIENVLSVKTGENITVSIEVSTDTKVSEVKTQNNKETINISQKKEMTAKNPTLNPKYTLDNFIEGENSDIAFRAAQVIAMNPGNNPFNPCLIYGGVGLGKTHLLQAIGNYIYANHPDMNIIYVTAESFTNEFIASFGNKESNNKFKKTYRNADVLLIDDIHFLQK